MVRRAIGSPSGCRIGFGGSCFPKDVKALAYMAQDPVVTHMLHAVLSLTSTSDGGLSRNCGSTGDLADKRVRSGVWHSSRTRMTCAGSVAGHYP
jgi:hypothetical protein